MPKFRDLETWRQAEQLMQPAFIRLIDNLRKQLEQSSWRGDYEEMPLWSEGTSDEVKAQVMQLRSTLAQATSREAIDQIEQALADLPEPFPGYFLRLSRADRQVTIDLWELCYQICFRDYDVSTGTSRSRGFGQPQSDRVEVDTSLLDETGEVDWNRLDAKTRKLVDQIFANLPA
jgi:hypothetical protein